MKLLPLTQGKFVQVDDEDFENVNQFKWFAHYGKGKWYACRGKRINGEQTLIYLHRYLMQTPTNMVVDHKDRDGLNCQRYNMRNTTQVGNMQNSDCKCNNKGVGLITGGSKFTSQIHVNGKKIHLGSFKTEREAALAYNKAAVEHFGEFARLNEVE